MTNYLEPLTDLQLAERIQDVKAGMLRAAELPLDRLHAGNIAKKECPEGDMPWQVGLLALMCLEKEVIRRGYDPKHPVYGVDVIGETLAIMQEMG